MTIPERRQGWLLLLLVILLWGINWPVMKVGLDFISPLTFAAIRLWLGALTLFPVAWLLGALCWPDRRDWPLVLSVGLIQMAAFLTLVTVALQYVSAGRSAILAYTTSLWVVPLAAVALGERLDRYRMTGLLLGLGGVAVLFNPLGFDWSDSAILIGNGLLLLGALLWALLIVQVRSYPMHGSPLSLGPWQFLIAAAAVTPIALLVEGGGGIRWQPELWLVLFYNGPIASAFCFWAIITVTRVLPAGTTSIGSLGVPAVGVLASLPCCYTNR